MLTAGSFLLAGGSPVNLQRERLAAEGWARGVTQQQDSPQSGPGGTPSVRSFRDRGFGESFPGSSLLRLLVALVSFLLVVLSFIFFFHQE